MKLSLKELEVVVADYVKSNKIAIQDFTATKNNIVGLLDKVGKIVTLDSNFYDKLPELDGDMLPFGRTIEEYFQDLIMPVDFDRDENGEGALKFYSATYRPVSYSYKLGKKTIPESIPNEDVEAGVNNESQFVSIITLMTKRISDSAKAYIYQVKRELLGKVCDLISTAYSGATAYVDATTDVEEGKTYKQTISSVVHTAVCVKSHDAKEGDTWAKLVASGVLIELQMIRTIAVPVDETTGENFIKEVKRVVEKAQDISEGFSLNGNTIGAEEGLALYVKQGVMPSLDVDTLAGAFHEEKLALGVNAKTIKDFGNTETGVYAMLIDPRGVKVHKYYDAVRENLNGRGDFLNLFRHIGMTCFASRNTFMTIFVAE